MLRNLLILPFLALSLTLLGQQLEQYNKEEIIFLDEYGYECTEYKARYIRVFEYDKVDQLYIARDYSMRKDNRLITEYFYSEVHPNKEVKKINYNLEDGTIEVITYEEEEVKPVRCIKVKNNKEVDCDKSKDGEYIEHYNEGYADGVATGAYKKGNRIGEWKYEIGGREIYSNYSDKGQLDGLFYEITSYDQTKNYERTYKNDKLNGWSTKWHTTGYADELGGVEAKIKYKDNAPIDTAFWYYPNGAKEVQLIFYPSDNKVWKTTWYESGTKSSEGWQAYEGAINPSAISEWAQFSHYADEVGMWKMWHENGKLSAEINHKDAVRDGKSIRYYENGQKSYEANFVEGFLEGEAKTWHSNGQLKSEGQFIDDRKVGKWKYFDANGNDWALNDETIFSEDFETPVNLSNPAYYFLKLQLIWMAEAVHNQDWDTAIKLCSNDHYANQFGYGWQNVYQGVPSAYYGSDEWYSFRNAYVLSILGLRFVSNNVGGDLTLVERIVYDKLIDEPSGYTIKFTVYLHDGTTREGRTYINGESFRFFSSWG